jgi:hypothetical protein
MRNETWAKGVVSEPDCDILGKRASLEQYFLLSGFGSQA